MAPCRRTRLDETEIATKDVKLLNVLFGLEAEGTTMLNTRKIKFLSVKEGKANEERY